MAKMFSSLRLATMRSHKKARPGSVATNASSDSARTADETNSQQQQQQSNGLFGPSFLGLEDISEPGCSPPTSLSSKVAQVCQGGSFQSDVLVCVA